MAMVRELEADHRHLRAHWPTGRWAQAQENRRVKAAPTVLTQRLPPAPKDAWKLASLLE